MSFNYHLIHAMQVRYYFLKHYERISDNGKAKFKPLHYSHFILIWKAICIKKHSCSTHFLSSNNGWKSFEYLLNLSPFKQVRPPLDRLPRRRSNYSMLASDLWVRPGELPQWMSCPPALTSHSVWSMAATDQEALYASVLALSIKVWLLNII